MSHCEDFPACGHEQGCCPRFKNGVQVEMICVCGARLPKDNPVSICNACLKDAQQESDPTNSDYSESDLNDYPEDTPMFYDYYGGE